MNFPHKIECSVLFFLFYFIYLVIPCVFYFFVLVLCNASFFKQKVISKNLFIYSTEIVTGVRQLNKMSMPVLINFDTKT